MEKTKKCLSRYKNLALAKCFHFYIVVIRNNHACFFKIGSTSHSELQSLLNQILSLVSC